MGLNALRGTRTYDFVRTCIPREDEISIAKIQGDYAVSVVPQNMGLLGTMCDYGVRSYFPMRDYAYLELGMIMSGVDEILDTLLTQFCLSAEEAYYLCSYRELHEPVSLNSSMERDYDSLVHRAIELYKCFNMVEPCFGRYYTVYGCVESFECDCVDRSKVLDLKLSNKLHSIKEYWTQLLLYSLLSKLVDNITRTTIGLVLPVQGEIRWFTYPKDQYYGILKVFKEMYGGE